MESFWSKKHPLTIEQDRLWNKYVPSNGSTEYLETELFLASNRLMYDYYNNGWGCNNKTFELDMLHQHGYMALVTYNQLARGADGMLRIEQDGLELYMNTEHARIIEKLLEAEANEALTPLKEEDQIFGKKWGMKHTDWEALVYEYHYEDDEDYYEEEDWNDDEE